MESSRKTATKTIDIGLKKEIRITEFKEQAWIHIVDKPKGKCVSFSASEFKDLMKKQHEIMKALKMIRKPKDSEDSSSKSKKRRREESDSETEDDLSDY